MILTVGLACGLVAVPRQASAEDVSNHNGAVENLSRNSDERKQILIDLAEEARSAGQDELAYRYEMSARGLSTYGVAGWIMKGAKWALRNYGNKLPKKIQPWAYKIADVLDQVEVWEVFAIESKLVTNGVPQDVAHEAAVWLVFVFG